MFEYGILQDAGKVTAEIAKLHAETVCLLSKAVDWYKTCLLNDEKWLNNQENGVRIYEIFK